MRKASLVWETSKPIKNTLSKKTAHRNYLKTIAPSAISVSNCAGSQQEEHGGASVGIHHGGGELGYRNDLGFNYFENMIFFPRISRHFLTYFSIYWMGWCSLCLCLCCHSKIYWKQCGIIDHSMTLSLSDFQLHNKESGRPPTR